MRIYEVVHIKPDNTEEIIATTLDYYHLPHITEQPKYLGDWITEDKKKLKWSRGMLAIRVKEYEPEIVGVKKVNLGSTPLYELQVDKDKELSSICLSQHSIVGYNKKRVPLWQTNSFSKLAMLIGKKTATKCREYYEQYLNEFKIIGSM